MPIVNDEEWGGKRVILNPFITIDKAVIILLGKSLTDYPFELFDEDGNHEATYALEDYLQIFYDDGDENLAEKGLNYYEQLLDAIESRNLVLHNNQLRVVRLLEWAKSKSILISDKTLLSITIETRGRQSGKHKQQVQAILEQLKKLGHDPLNLPPFDHTSGPKSQVKKLLNGKELFTGGTVFEKAWTRLSTSGKIRYQE